MNNSYNYSGLLDLLSSGDEKDSHRLSRHNRAQSADGGDTHDDESPDKFLFSSALTDIYYTD